MFFDSTEQNPREVNVTEAYSGNQLCRLSQED